jgi:outer membrane protein assembly factor BamB
MRFPNQHMPFSLLILTVSILPVNAQVDILWTHVYDDSVAVRAYDVHESADGNYLITGSVTLDRTSKEDYRLIKTDSTGTAIWSRTYGYVGNERPLSAATAHGGHFIVCGGSWNSTYTTRVSWIVYVDTNGDTVWTRKYPDHNLHGVESTTDGGFIFTGSLDDKLVLFRTDQVGNELWTKKYGHLPSYGYDVMQVADGGFIAAGYIDSLSQEAGAVKRAWLLRTDSDGDSLWSRRFHSDNSIDYLFFVDETDDGGFVSVGQRTIPSGRSIFAARTDEEGRPVWTRTFEDEYKAPKSAVQTKDGDIIVTGQFKSPNGSYELFLQAIDRNGKAKWLKYGINYGTGEAISTTLAGDYLVVGESYFHSYSSIWLLKVHPYPEAIITTDRYWLDQDWDGYEYGTIVGNESTGVPHIDSYRWKVNGQDMGGSDAVAQTLPTGTHQVELSVTDTYGYSDTMQTDVDVLAYLLPTEGSISSGVSSIGDSLFFISSADDRIYHFDKSGSLLWFLQTGGDIQSTTTIGPDNNIYVGSSDTRLYAFSVMGNFLWDLPMGGTVTASPAITPQGTLFIGVNNHRLYSVNTTDGVINWNFLTGGEILASPSISDSGIVYVGSDDYRLYAINQAGEMQWLFQTNGPIRSSPALDSLGHIYFGSMDGYLYSLNPKGQLRWSLQTNGSIESSPIINAEGDVIFGSSDGFVYCTSDSGAILWKYQVDVPVKGTGAITPSGSIIIGCDDGSILALSSTGEYLWHCETGERVVSPPLITSEGKIYVGSHDGILYGLAEPIEEVAKQYSSHVAIWPTFQGNNRRTGYQDDVPFGMGIIPAQFNIEQNYPNPFNEATTVVVDISEPTHILLVIYDIRGRELVRLVDDHLRSDKYAFQWHGTAANGKNLPTGIYIARLVTPEYSKSIKMLLLK